MRHNYVSLDKKVNVVNDINVLTEISSQTICLECLRNTIPDSVACEQAFGRENREPVHRLRQCNLEDTQITQAS